MDGSKELCEFGEKCYRLQENHFLSFQHPHLDTLLEQMPEDEVDVPTWYEPQIARDTLLSQLNIVKYQKFSKSIPHSSRSEPEPVAGSSSHSSKMDAASVKRGLNDYMEYVRKRCKGDVLTKLQHSEPYRFFLSSISAERKTHEEMLTLSFPELLSQKLGVLESSLQINFMVQIGWLLAQYAVNNEKSTPITLLYGCEDSELTESIRKKLIPNVTAHFIKPSAFGSHHTKMMILSYQDKSIRVVVTTGNLIEFDWENTTQGLWVSPRLQFIETKSEEPCQFDSETNFKRDLLQYLRNYNLPIMDPWIEKVENADFREIKVFFVASTPGTHPKKAAVNWGLSKMTTLLSQNAIVPNENAKDWSLCYQCSSIGSLGKDPHSWLLGEFTGTMSTGHKCASFQPPVKLIYPSFEDVASSHDGLLAGGCLPYSKSVHEKQPWLNNHLCKWRCTSRHRNRGMPHIKTYCRFSPCKKYLSWFLLTSANLSKAAWGMENKAKTDLRILNYEVGVLFIPSLLIKKQRFPLTNANSSEDGPEFPLPYDLPLTPYSSGDLPWFIDMLQQS
ncbi:hypothetical protein V9T40_014075 [Parthenolecanium corni]|uniref:PBZ-type domain-containing protein n=1 Tax=Parthenolecanium corni TaxID=536013 RepID=A0AAN9TC97_9HEMI